MQDPRKFGKYAVPTKANMKFMPWWKLLNENLDAKGQPECQYGVARDYYEMGFCPQTAATELMVSRDA